MENNIHFYVLQAQQLNEILKLPINANNRIYIENSIALNNLDLISCHRELTFYLCSPQIMRRKDIKPFVETLESGLFKGVLIRNLETYSYINSHVKDFANLELVLDSNMYVLNKEALAFYLDNNNFDINEYYVSFELNDREERELINELRNVEGRNVLHSSVIYGRIPMMVSANCLRKTIGGECRKLSGIESIVDRKNIEFPFLYNCDYCYNVLYNSVVLSLHRYYLELIKRGNVRLDFTDESPDLVKERAEYFLSLSNNVNKEPPYKEYTTGHFKRGVE